MQEACQFVFDDKLCITKRLKKKVDVQLFWVFDSSGQQISFIDKKG